MNYKYEITAGKVGGEHTIGTIPNSVGLHWLNRRKMTLRITLLLIELGLP